MLTICMLDQNAATHSSCSRVQTCDFEGHIV